MANCITRHIPNFLTCMNLFSGCVAAVMAFEYKYDAALLFVIFSAVFDFFDGMFARLLNAHSPIGKDLDSLADNVSFGLVPSLILFSLLREMSYPAVLAGIGEYIPYFAFLISIFSALRLAKFNIDTRQSTSFIGLPVPANALFWAAGIAGYHDVLKEGGIWLPVLLVLAVCFSLLMVSELPMFSLKFKNLSWRDNKLPYIFLAVSAVLILFFGLASVIAWYILLCLSLKAKG